MVNHGNIDVVVTDLKMPKLDGLQLLEKLKSNPKTKHIPVILLTGKGEEESAVQGLRLGVSDYLMKDIFTREGLDRSILNALENLELRRQAEKYRCQLEDKVAELKDTLALVKTLEELLPVCMFCKKIRTNEQSWQTLETYIEEHSEISFSHSMCSDCAKKNYPSHVR